MRPFFVSLAEVFRLLCPYLRLGLNTVTYRQQCSLAAGITTASDAWGQIRLTHHDVLPGMSARGGGILGARCLSHFGVFSALLITV